MNQPVASALNHCLSPARARVPLSASHAGMTIDAPIAPANYARMFPELPSFDADEQFLRALGRAGGLCDCGDVDDVPDSLGDTAAGWPIFGQFVAHDITADRSLLRSHANTAELRNSRSPQLNLESLYGDGPTGHPFLYQRDDPAKFLLGSDRADLQRNAEGIAVIGDPRNDSHTLVSQLHLAMLKAHNAFVDDARAAGTAADHVFEEASRQLRWNYQWIVLERVSARARWSDPCRSGAPGRPAVVSSWCRGIHTARICRRSLPLWPLSDSPPLPLELAHEPRTALS